MNIGTSARGPAGMNIRKLQASTRSDRRGRETNAKRFSLRCEGRFKDTGLNGKPTSGPSCPRKRPTADGFRKQPDFEMTKTRAGLSRPARVLRRWVI
jgi:hypothetical protein